ncbi:MAG: hypothetical protein HOK21_21660 [Rhodospirillaceae bacterium]|nr:hypothetical protein [Rhodospirillaceae bacterium]MBT5082182.1 hypothetical protein [Rhodospirillaceae bacterium]MBT5526701.1 hypothetical protein [Rhodospirillaceae bacterium]MBT5878461.1 hypothetical protein [Rhodospirillaceae bacterium]MBT6589771.1 hypothetical protein [Rhodospirillaceae bacterium]
MTEIIIDRRFRGPPNSGNGGYVCGILAGHIGPKALAAEVTLHKPIPLDLPLAVTGCPNEIMEMHCGDDLVATARPTELKLEDLPRATYPDARAASRATPFTEANHDVSGCFVCGPARKPGDGLRILAGPLADDPTVYASHWIPGDDLAGSDGLVRDEFIWSCLDCPTGHVLLSSGFENDEGDTSILLGRMSARIIARPKPGDHCTITARPGPRSGRKWLADGALYGADGALLAMARATWITVPRSLVTG